MNKNRIRLTESQLHNVIKESVKNVLNENANLGIQDELWFKVKNVLTKAFGNNPNLWIEDNGDEIDIHDKNAREGITITYNYSAADFYDA